jgi:hypothetical protein
VNCIIPLPRTSTVTLPSTVALPHCHSLLHCHTATLPPIHCHCHCRTIIHCHPSTAIHPLPLPHCHCHCHPSTATHTQVLAGSKLPGLVQERAQLARGWHNFNRSLDDIAARNGGSNADFWKIQHFWLYLIGFLNGFWRIVGFFLRVLCFVWILVFWLFFLFFVF